MIIVIVGFLATAGLVYRINRVDASLYVSSHLVPTPEVILKKTKITGTVSFISPKHVTVETQHFICAICNNGGPGSETQTSIFYFINTKTSKTQIIFSKTNKPATISDIATGGNVTVLYNLRPYEDEHAKGTSTHDALEIQIN